ncbi:MAG: diaminopimelate epimerase [Kineosporiaceae bacterium]
MDTRRLVKGHGTENDFLVAVDPDGSAGPLDPAVVAALCRRRGGLGADGVIRAVRVADAPEAAAWAADAPDAEWFMDYRNADGSPAEMCGNGVRVMAEVLAREGLVDPAGVTVLTRSGGRRLVRETADPVAGWWSVGMGRVGIGVPDGAATDAAPGDSDVDTLVAAPGLTAVPRPGMRVTVGNPHVVVAVTGRDELEAVDLGRSPVLDPPPADGANVEFVLVTGRDEGTGAGLVTMRVHERGSGETRSCGTGAVAAAAAAAEWARPGAPVEWVVDVRGGRLRVRLEDDGTATLTGPVRLLGTVAVDQDWWRDLAPEPAGDHGPGLSPAVPAGA